MTLYYWLLAFAGFLDSLNDDWRDRPNAKEDSRVNRFFVWLKEKVGWTGVWRWYEGTKNGQPPMRFWGVAIDFWHSVKIVKLFILVVVAPFVLLPELEGSFWSIAPPLLIGYALEAAVFVLFYNFLWRIKK